MRYRGRVKGLWLVAVVLAVNPGALGAEAGSESSHGEQQLDAVMRDRPRLARSLTPRPRVKKWIIDRFNEADPPLVWDAMPPVSGRAAEFDARDRVRTKRPVGVPSHLPSR
jgi:hypothetical protein